MTTHPCPTCTKPDAEIIWMQLLEGPSKSSDEPQPQANGKAKKKDKNGKK
ncbi:MAG: hypothetical protein ACFCD0_17365 [Gemmataceae bacterium]